MVGAREGPEDCGECNRGPHVNEVKGVNSGGAGQPLEALPARLLKPD